MFEIPENCYRTFGNPQQIPVFSNADLKVLIEQNQPGQPSFISICWFDEAHESVLPEVFFDFDGSELEATWKDVKKLVKFFDSEGLRPFYIFFTGNRGFHVHLEIKPNTYSKRELRAFQEYLINTLNLKTACRSVVGDVRRLCRIPNTRHENTGLYCIQVNINQTIPEILELAKKPQPIKTEICPEYLDLRELIKRFRIYNQLKQNNNHFEIRADTNYANCDNEFYKEIFKYHPCLLNEILTEEPANSVRVWTTSFLLEQGFSYSWIFKFFESCNWIDFNKYKTAYHLKRIKENGGYSTPSCTLIQNEGFCIGHACRNFKKEKDIFD